MKQCHFTFTESSGSHKLAYTQWGETNNPKVLLCVHGLTRTGRDFDFLAQALSNDYRVICPDVFGRGESDWLTQPENYNLFFYAAGILGLLEQLQITQLDWLGTSMGGLIGMIIASAPNSPIRRLIINDVGPFISQQGMQRVAGYLLKEKPIFADLVEAEKYVRETYQPFGDLTDEQWQHLTKYSVKSLAEGGYILNYDPQISYPYQKTPIDSLKQQEFWEFWKGINCPILLLHGQDSDLLSPSTITEMQAIQPEMKVISFPYVGHAPALMDASQIRAVKTWLN